MVSHNSSNKFSKKKVSKKTSSKNSYPKIVIDRENDFISIKLKSGVEAKSYSKKGVLFSEDANGKIIEIQIIN